MRIDDFVDKDCDLTAEEMLLVLHRLNLEDWVFDGISINTGDVPLFDSRDPDKPIIRTDTESLRDIVQGIVRIDISARHGQRHQCPCCGKTMNVEKWVVTDYQTSPLAGMKTILRVRVPQFVCKECNIYSKLRCPAVVEGHTYTKILKLDVLKMVSKETVKSTSESCRIGEWIVYDILKQTVFDGLETQDLSDVEIIFMDEIQSTHGQEYTTMAADQNHRMICGVHGHDANSVWMVKEWLLARGGKPENVKYVCCDMSTGYKSGVKECFPNAKLIIDIFHLDNMVGKALDDARKRINKELKKKGEDELKNIKYTILYRKKNQKGINLERMESIRMNNPELALAFDLKEEFFDLFDRTNTKKNARSAFFRWYNRCRGSHIPEMLEVADRMLKRLNDILRWFDFKITNAVSEGLNSVYKKIKSAAYGFKNIWNLINLCLFRKGTLVVTI